VSAAGDVNGDGLADIIVTAPYGGGTAGAAYLVFGMRGGFGSTFNVSQLNGSNGTKIISSGITYASGVGDVNGDGFDEIAIGTGEYTSYSAPRFVVFGTAAGLGATFDAATLDGSNGFIMNGHGTVAGAGDINGDGIDDLAFTDGYNSFVVFGHTGPFLSPFQQILDGQNGFDLDSSNVDNFGGFATLTSAGDVNGDGFDDLVSSSFGYSPFYYDEVPSSPFSYIILGKAEGFTPAIDLSTLSGPTGFKIYAGPYAAGAGDVNGDGVADILVGRYNERHSAVSAYVIFGEGGKAT
jgi:hypothetical protein